MGKYNEMLKKYDLNLNEAAVKNEIKKILDADFNKNNNLEVWNTIHSCIDLTSLSTEDNKESIYKFTKQVNDFDGTTPTPTVAAICVFPNMVSVVKDTLTAQANICAVAGGFPSSQTFMEIKIAEVSMALADGADEIDIVLNLGLFNEGNYQELCEEITEIKDKCGDKKLKVILETGALKSLTDVKKASLLSLYSGADFIKTSTGKVYSGASLEAAYVMCSAIKEYKSKTGVKAGFKASGGVSTTENAVEYYSIFKHLLGAENTNNKCFRIGASSLVKNLLGKIQE